MTRGVTSGPDGILIGVLRPVAMALMWEPPTSTTRIFTVRLRLPRTIARPNAHYSADFALDAYRIPIDSRTPPPCRAHPARRAALAPLGMLCRRSCVGYRPRGL